MSTGTLKKQHRKTNRAKAAPKPPAETSVTLAAVPDPKIWPKHVRPGFICYDDNTGWGTSLVLKKCVDGRMLLLNSRGNITTASAEDFRSQYGEIPPPGSIFDRLADYIAGQFFRWDETRPFATRNNFLPIFEDPDGQKFKAELYKMIHVTPDPQRPDTVDDLLEQIGFALLPRKPLLPPSSRLLGDSIAELEDLREHLHEQAGKWWGSRRGLHDQAMEIDRRLEELVEDLTNLAKNWPADEAAENAENQAIAKGGEA